MNDQQGPTDSLVFLLLFFSAIVNPGSKFYWGCKALVKLTNCFHNFILLWQTSLTKTAEEENRVILYPPQVWKTLFFVRCTVGKLIFRFCWPAHQFYCIFEIFTNHLSPWKSTAWPLLVGRELAVLSVKQDEHVKFWIKLSPVKVMLSNVVSCTLSTLFPKLTVITVLIFSQYYLTQACRCWRQTKTLLMSW